MITTLSRALVKFAADRWPPHLRDGLRQEWLAELAVLAHSGEHMKALRFAASLAAHPAPRPSASATAGLARVWYAFRVLLVGPVLCQLLLLLSFLGMSLSTGSAAMSMLPSSAVSILTRLQLPMLTLLCIAWACLAALIGRRWSPGAPGFLLPVLIATVPGFLFAATLLTKVGIDSANRHLLVFEVFFLGFGAVLYAAARLARAGRRRLAWWVGAVGAFVALDIAVMPAVLRIQMSPEEGAINPAWAPMWLIALLTDQGLGPTPSEVFTITDVLIGVPQILIIVTGWALGMVLGRSEAGGVLVGRLVDG